MTVAEVQSAVLPPDTRLLAGASGLGRQISWPVTLRTRPPAFQSLKGGEFLLISNESMRLLDPNLTLARLLQSVSRQDIAAAAVVGDVSEDTREQAESAGIPLFALPPGTVLSELDQAISRGIVEWQADLQRQSQEIYRHLTELALEGRGVPAIAGVLARTTGRTVAFEDRSFALTLYSGHGGPPGDASVDDLTAAFRFGQADLIDWLRSRRVSPSDPPLAEFTLPGLGLVRLVAPIVLREGAVGYLSLIGDAGGFRELERQSIARGAAACAIELMRESATLDAEERAGATFLDELLTGAPVSAEAIRRLASRLGIDLAQPQIVLLFRQHLPPRRESHPAPTQPPGAVSALHTAIEREYARRQVRALCRSWEDTAAVVCRAPKPDAMYADLQGLANALTARLGTPVSVGAGRPRVGAEGIPDSYREAQGALNLGSRLFGPGRVTYYGDLGLYRLLLAMSETNELRAFYEETLGKLQASDTRANGELLRTLEAYFASRCSPTEAAERLHVHRNTLLYRLRRIETISGLDLEDPETRLALNLALHAGQVLGRT